MKRIRSGSGPSCWGRQQPDRTALWLPKFAIDNAPLPELQFIFKCRKGM
jgi:hypothetical protein